MQSLELGHSVGGGSVEGWQGWGAVSAARAAGSTASLTGGSSLTLSVLHLSPVQCREVQSSSAEVQSIARTTTEYRLFPSGVEV